MVEPEEPQMMSQYGAYALHAGQAMIYARTRKHTPTCPGARERARTNTQKYVIIIPFPR